MPEKDILTVKSLKDQVYDYLREQMSSGEMRPGSVVNLDATSRKLGISKTPLREALIMLEMEGFVRILPRKGVFVQELSLREIRDFYQIIGALECVALMRASKKLQTSHIEKMAKCNQAMKEALERDSFEEYYARNLDFHNTFIELGGNEALVKIINTLKKRLYDFPRREGYVKKWEEESIGEHRKILDWIREGKISEAAQYIRDVHWSFEVQEPFIHEYYQVQKTKHDNG